MRNSERYDVPVCKKALLTLDEAADYFNIGKCKIRELSNASNCNFVLFVGTRRLIKRRLFEQYLDGIYSV